MGGIFVAVAAGAAVRVAGMAVTKPDVGLALGGGRRVAVERAARVLVGLVVNRRVGVAEKRTGVAVASAGSEVSVAEG